MPAHLSVATVIEKNRIRSTEAFLYLLEVEVIDPKTRQYVETMRFCRNDEAISYQGNLYTAANFDIEVKQETGSVPEIRLSCIDYSRALQARMQLYGGGVGFNVKIIVVTTADITQPPDLVEDFRVISASAADYAVSFTLGAENPLTLRFPMHNQYADRCRWRFKSPQCGYAGELQTCDLSLQGPNGCAAHGNERRFGGFPGLNTVQ